jgi:hypothetical protein
VDRFGVAKKQRSTNYTKYREQNTKFSCRSVSFPDRFLSPNPKSTVSEHTNTQPQLSLLSLLVFFNDAQRSCEEIELFTQTILEIAQVGKMQAPFAA